MIIFVEINVVVLVFIWMIGIGIFCIFTAFYKRVEPKFDQGLLLHITIKT